MQQNFYLGLSSIGFHKLAYTQWGTNHKDSSVICVHGLTRNSRDFDELAKVLQSDFQVICPDIVGRGRSDWLPKRKLYNFQQYLSDLTTLIARLDIESVSWVGTSMGGLLGIILASLPGSPIKKLVINDVGPSIPKLATLPLLSYASQAKTFDSIKAIETYLRKIYAPFGQLEDHHWKQIAQHSHFKTEHGQYQLAFDPKITGTFWSKLCPVNLWENWKKIPCPILVLRGQNSKILPPKVANKMQELQPSMSLIEIPNVGHAPALVDEMQIKLIYDWLYQGD